MLSARISGSTPQPTATSGMHADEVRCTDDEATETILGVASHSMT